MAVRISWLLLVSLVIVCVSLPAVHSTEQPVVASDGEYVVLATGNTGLSELGGYSSGGGVRAERRAGVDSYDSLSAEESCEQDVEQFLRDNDRLVRSKAAGSVPQTSNDTWDMLFFLHAPRTAGRNFLNCFLTPATPPSKRCASSYDLLRLNVSVADCGLLSSHDDYSVTELLPDTAAIITQVRDPIQRVLSAYEFLVEVAAAEITRKPDKPRDAKLVATANVWPWSELLPMMEADMLARVKQAKSTLYYAIDRQWVEHRDPRTGRMYYHNYYTKQSVWSVTPEDGIVVPGLDPYDNPLAMPLREFIDHPLVHDTLHNGQTLQLLGLTEYSHLETSSKLRSCISGRSDVREAMTDAALARLDTLLHVGVTDRPEESIASAATTLGWDLGGPSWRENAVSRKKKDEADDVVEDEAVLLAREHDRLALEMRISELTESIAYEGREFRKARLNMQRVLQEAAAGTNESQVYADNELFRLQSERDQAENNIADLRRQISDLEVQAVKLKTPPPRVHQPAAHINKNDSELLDQLNVTGSYHRCVSGERAQNTLRWKAYLGLTTLDGRGFYHSSETRRHISPRIMERIRHLNTMDVHLYEAASKRLNSSIEKQMAAGKWQELLPAEPFPGIYGRSVPPRPPIEDANVSSEAGREDPKPEVATSNQSDVFVGNDSGSVVLPTGNTQLPVFGGVSAVELGEAGDDAELEETCNADVAQFIDENRALVREKGTANASHANPKDMTFFLHVPRTAGRTFLTCFLRLAVPPSKRCAKSYDVLRLNVSVPDCGLLSSHDDYSVTELLPDTAAVITQIRDPLERVVSAYEFVVTSALTGLRTPLDAPKPKAAKTVTTNIWPWSLLVPWMEADMRARVEQVKSTATYPPAKQWVEHRDPRTGRVYYHNYYTKRSVWSVTPEDGIVVPALDPYDNPLAMPLREFIEHPLVRDTLHNGQTLQVLGLTNYSHLEKSSKLRSCMSGLSDVREAMTDAALARLGTLFHVGVTERLEESIASAAAALGLDLGGPAWRLETERAFSYDGGVEATDDDDAERNRVTEQARSEIEARISDITSMITVKGRELRLKKAEIKEKENMSYEYGQSTGDADELSQLVADSQQMAKGIDDSWQEISDLQVELVKLKSPDRKMHSVAAQFVREDGEFLTGRNLTTEYTTCSSGTRVMSSNRWKNFADHVTADGRSFFFSSETRKFISPELVGRIRLLNSMDVRLHEAANRLLANTLERQAAAGILQKMPAPQPSLTTAGFPRPPLPSESSSSLSESSEVGRSEEQVTSGKAPQAVGEAVNMQAQQAPEAATPASPSNVVLSTGNTQLPVFGGVDSGVVEDTDETTVEEATEPGSFCNADVAQFLRDNRKLLRSKEALDASHSNPKDMLFFLHAPRTAGSTFLTCFLNPATPPSKRCGNSYDILRLNVSAAGCGLLSSHDDYSVTKLLPETTAVATQVRDPVKRLLSAYEFVVSVAATQLRMPMGKPMEGVAVTSNVWPWSEVVPWVEADMAVRAERVKSTAVYSPAKQWVEHRDPRTGRVYYHNYYTKRSVWSVTPEDGIIVPALDPYDNPLAMPLREFIEHPLVRDTLHNGQTLQLLGLTSYSHLNESSTLRSCISKRPDVREAMTDAALARLNTLLHVGVTDRLEESIAAAATNIGIDLAGPTWRDVPAGGVNATREAPSEAEIAEHMDKIRQSQMPLEAKIDDIMEMIVEKGRELRRGRMAIKQAQDEKDVGGDQLGDGGEKVTELVAQTHRLGEEIEALHQQIADLKVEIVKLKVPQPKVQNTTAKMIENDDEFLNPLNVANNHEICAIHGVVRTSQKWASYSNLLTLDGRGFYHSSETRKHIAPDTLARIRHLNSMDMELYESANKLLTATLHRQAAAGTRQFMPPPKPLLQTINAPRPPLPTEDIDHNNLVRQDELITSTGVAVEANHVPESDVAAEKDHTAYLTTGVNVVAEELHQGETEAKNGGCPIEIPTFHDEL